MIRSILVHPADRRQGVATALIRAVKGSAYAIRKQVAIQVPENLTGLQLLLRQAGVLRQEMEPERSVQLRALRGWRVVLFFRMGLAMKKVFGGPHRGLYAKLPTICAELTESIKFCQRGARVYFVVRPDPDSEFAELIGLTRLNALQAIVARWHQIRFPEIRDVRHEIAERCWRGTKEETYAALEIVKQKLGSRPDRNPYAPDIEI